MKPHSHSHTDLDSQGDLRNTRAVKRAHSLGCKKINQISN